MRRICQLPSKLKLQWLTFFIKHLVRFPYPPKYFQLSHCICTVFLYSSLTKHFVLCLIMKNDMPTENRSFCKCPEDRYAALGAISAAREISFLTVWMLQHFVLTGMVFFTKVVIWPNICMGLRTVRTQLEIRF